jgi:hypothetical protein
MLVSSGADRASRSPSCDDLVGRWRSDTASTGYWIIDRYNDGRYATQRFLIFDLAKPAELTLEWGRWKVSNGYCSDVIEGTTSPTLQRWWVGKRSRKILSFKSRRFSFESHDNQPRTEEKQQIGASLIHVETPPPKDAARKQLIDTVSTSLKKIPAWVKSPPRQ